MSIRPVDMQVMIQRVPELNRMTNNDGSRQEVQNNQFANQFAKATQDAQKQVIEANEAEKQELDKDSKGRGSSQQERHKAEREAEEQAEDKKTPTPGKGMLDIMM
ncbi:MAG: hypothetical protein FWB98_03750 [Defluviitaleaceae bacterium]|nr:hypothetical protein [Defluviitaleaceae bacterium]